MTNEQKSTIMRLRSEGCKYAAIAEVVGLSINTVKSYCRRQSINAAVAAPPDENGVPLCKQCGKPLEHMPILKSTLRKKTYGHLTPRASC